MSGYETLQEDRLGMCGVLVLVDEDMPVAAPDGFSDRGIGQEAGSLREKGSVVDNGTITKGSVVAVEERREATPICPVLRTLGEIGRADELLSTPENEVGDFIGEGAGRQERPIGR